jgi:hypothetical protein
MTWILYILAVILIIEGYSRIQDRVHRKVKTTLVKLSNLWNWLK